MSDDRDLPDSVRRDADATSERSSFEQTLRQYGFSPRRTGTSGFEQWLEDVVWGMLEVSILGMPALLSVASTSTFFVERHRSAAVALVVLTLAVGTIRGGRTRLASDWPPVTNAMLLLRAGYYSGTLALAAYGGAMVEVYAGGFAATAFAAVIALLAVVSFPGLATWVRSRIPRRPRTDYWDR